MFCMYCLCILNPFSVDIPPFEDSPNLSLDEATFYGLCTTTDSEETYEFN